jgi:hypothetical protein
MSIFYEPLPKELKPSLKVSGATAALASTLPPPIWGDVISRYSRHIGFADDTLYASGIELRAWCVVLLPRTASGISNVILHYAYLVLSIINVPVPFEW